MRKDAYRMPQHPLKISILLAITRAIHLTAQANSSCKPLESIMINKFLKIIRHTKIYISIALLLLIQQNNTHAANQTPLLMREKLPSSLSQEDRHTSANSTQKESPTCAPKDTDVCKIARKMADELAPQLPMQLSSQLSLQTVVAVKSNFLMTLKLEYDNTYLQTMLINSGIRSEEMIKIMHQHAISGICKSGSPTKAFIDLGGLVSYLYRFNDGTVYTQVQINSCL